MGKAGGSIAPRGRITWVAASTWPGQRNCHHNRTKQRYNSSGGVDDRMTTTASALSLCHKPATGRRQLLQAAACNQRHGDAKPTVPNAGGLFVEAFCLCNAAGITKGLLCRSESRDSNLFSKIRVDEKSYGGTAKTGLIPWFHRLIPNVLLPSFFFSAKFTCGASEKRKIKPCAFLMLAPFYQKNPGR